MKIKISDMQGVLTSSVFNRQLPVKTSYALAKIGKLFNEELKTFEEQRMKVIEKYEGKLVEDGSKFEFSDGNRELVDKEIKELWEMEVEMAVEPISISAFGNVELTPNDISLLSPIVVD